ncbi:MAG: hypothetical protein ABH950_00115 [Candidatus Altiarchaeota archaeon]
MRRFPKVRRRGTPPLGDLLETREFRVGFHLRCKASQYSADKIG